jgi:hypothetical protein
MSELTEAIAELKKDLLAAIPTVESVAQAAAAKLLPVISAAAKDAVQSSGPIGAIGSVVADPLIDDADAYILALVNGLTTPPPTTAPAPTIATLSQKIAALTVATGAAGTHALASATAAVAKMPAPAPTPAKEGA